MFIRKSGRSVPLFNDKHLSWKWEWAKEMYDTARAMNFGFMAGSSLPVTWRIPKFEMPLRTLLCARPFAFAMAVWTATTFMDWKVFSAWWSGARAASRA